MITSFPCYPHDGHAQMIHLELILQPPLIPQGNQLLHHLIQRNNLPSLLAFLIIPIPHISSLILLLLCTHHNDEIVQRELRGANFLLHRVAADVDVGVEAFGAEARLDFFNVIVYGGHDRDDHDLAGGDPEGPAAGEVLGEDAAGA